MNILVSLNENYLRPLQVMLTSLFTNNGPSITLYLLHFTIPEPAITALDQLVTSHGSELVAITVDPAFFDDALVNSYYSKEMYLRLLCHRFLPKTLDRILYLDPDILVLNSLENLYHRSLGTSYYAAAAHDFLAPIPGYINQLRLNTDSKHYYNSGVLLINLSVLRASVDESTIYGFINENKERLLLPDQDVLNALFWEKITPISEVIYNYDARRYTSYFLKTGGKFTVDYVIQNTVILHFCGKQKPWNPNYSYRFGILYHHYEHQWSKHQKRLLNQK